MIKCINCDEVYHDYSELKRDKRLLDVINRDPFYGAYEPILVCPYCGRDEFDEIREDEE